MCMGFFVAIITNEINENLCKIVKLKKLYCSVLKNILNLFKVGYVSHKKT
jgi:hypothetical protein